MLHGTRAHARRRAHEMRDAVELLEHLGVPTSICRAAADAFERIAAESGDA